MNDDRGVFREVEVSTGVDGALRGKLTRPSGRVRGGIVPLHSADDGSPDHFLVRHLAQVLPALGIAVLRYDRRPAPAAGRPVPLPEQAADALAAADLIRRHCGPVPVGLWGFSHGGWAAPLAAAGAGEEVAFLVLVSASGVSPAEQMRHYTARLVRRAGHGDEAVAELLKLRTYYEQYLRGELDLPSMQQAIDAVADRPWFDLADVDRHLTPDDNWHDMDFDPAEAFCTVRCPTLLFYGEDDENVPAAESMAAWRRIALEAEGEGISIVRLPVGTTHLPTTGPENTIDAICPEYTRELTAWLDDRLDELATVAEG
ncbi:MAG TPA: CocE/NonD family hydrolase [Actinocrinis sp.]|nr:CocE/NonD family hydrolase [Actinocrinis sp.]